MEGEPDSWTTVEKKLPKKKGGRDESKDQAGEKGQGGDRRKKDSVGSRSDRGDRRPDNRRSDRGGGNQGGRGGQQGEKGEGRRPPSGRGGSSQRNTLPRKPRDGDSGQGGKDSGARVPHRSGGAQGPGAVNNVEKKANTVVANPWEALAASSSNSSSSNTPRKQSWASLVDRGPSEPREKSPSPASKPTITATPAPTAWASKTAPSEAPISAPAPTAWASKTAPSEAPVSAPAPTAWATKVAPSDAPVSAPAPTAWATKVAPSEAPVSVPAPASTVDSVITPAPGATVSATAPSITSAATVSVPSATPVSVPSAVPAGTPPPAVPVKITTPPNTAPAHKPVSPWALDAPVFVPRSIPPPVVNEGGFKKPAIISASAPEFVPKSALVKEVIGAKDTLQKPLADLAVVSNESKSQNTVVSKTQEEKELKTTIDPIIKEDETKPLISSTPAEEDTKPNLQNKAAEIDKDAINISNDNVAKQVETVIPENLECDTKQVANHELSKNEIVVQEETDSSANVSTNPTQQTTNDITSDETKSEAAAVTEVSNSSVVTKLDDKTGDSLDNDQDGPNTKVETPAKDDSLDANGNNVSLDSNKNKVTKGMTPDMEDMLSKIDPDSRMYDRDILLLLQKHPLSLQKPDKLPELEIVLDVPLRSSSSAPLLGDKPHGVSIANSFARPGGMPTRRDSRRKEPKKVISISREPVKLRTSDNAYKPGKENKPKDNDALEILGKKVRAILNKLTPQKFQTLVVQFKEIEINTEERLALAIELIFEKAVEEPAYSTAYASLCKELSLKRVTKEGSDEIVDFRSLLLEQCRNEFQRDYLSEADRKKYAEDMKNAETEDEKRKVKTEFELLESKMRKRSLGNMRFIGELYLQQLTRQQIIHQNIISRLLSTIEEESLECLCRFLTTCGAKLQADQLNIPENMREQFSFDRYFTRIKSIIDEKKTSSRVRFMLQDLIELRANKWVNKRRKEAGPKTIDDIHKEAKIEALKVQLNDSQHSAPVARRSEEKNRRKTEFRPPKASHNADDGWNNVPTRAAKVSLDMDPEKLRSIRKVDADSLRLGGGYTSWGMGSSSSASKASSISKRPANMFELLEDVEQPLSQPAHTEVSHLYAGRASEPVIRSHDRSSSRASASLDEHREDSRNNSAERSSNVLRGSADMDTEALRSKFKLLLREYLSNCDFQETVNSVCELFSQSTIEILVEETVNQGLEENVLNNRSACGRLLYGLVKEGALNQETICRGLSMTLEIAEDMIIDIPKFWEFLADMLVIVVVELSCFDALVRGCANHLPDLTSRKKFITSLLLAIKKTHQDKLSEYISKHKGLVEELLSQNITEILQECNISVDSAAVASGAVKGPSDGEEKLVNGNLQESLHRQLTNLLEKGETGNKEIEAVDKIMRDKPIDNETIRTLVYAVMESVVSKEGSPACSVNKDLLSERIPILKKYIDATKERELFAMFALQNLVNKLHHPNKLLHNMIEQLYDGEVISDDGIFDWENNLDVDEQEGKGVAVAGCKQFLEWLRTAEEAEASEEESP